MSNSIHPRSLSPLYEGMWHDFVILDEPEFSRELPTPEIGLLEALALPGPSRSDGVVLFRSIFRPCL